MRIVRVHRSPAVAMALAGLLAALAAGLVASPSVASAATPAVGWDITSIAQPTNFAPTDKDAVQQVTVRATGGSYTLTFAGKETGAGHETAETTVAIASDASAEAVRTDLEALSEIGTGNVEVSGGPGDESGSNPYTVTFVGALAGVKVAPLEVGGSSLTGGAEAAAAAVLRKGGEVTDAYTLVVTNVGSVASSASEPVKVVDTLPQGVTATAIKAEVLAEPEATGGAGKIVACVLATLTCETQPGVTIAPFYTFDVTITVKPEAVVSQTSVVNAASVSGGGGAAMSTSSTAGSADYVSANTIDAAAPTPFALDDFDFGVSNAAGSGDAQAGDHPNAVVATVATPTKPVANVGLAEGGIPYPEVEEPKDIVTELPLGFVGDPAAAAQCSLAEAELHASTKNFDEENGCPPDSIVGYAVVMSYGRVVVGSVSREVVSTGDRYAGTSPIYNVTPEPGYPAEFVVSEFEIPVHLYAAVVRHGSEGYRLRVFVPSFIRADDLDFEQLIFFGDPTAVDGGGAGAPFFTDSSDCAAAPTATIYEDTWQNPADVPLNANGSPDLDAVNLEESQWAKAESSLPTPTGCGLLAPLFTPSLSIAPTAASEEGSSQADSPSAYGVSLEVPQSSDPTAGPPLLESSFDEKSGTPPVKDVTVSLPAGVSVSPSAATGLQGCTVEQERLESNEPSACPEGSKIGTVELKTPLLAKRDMAEGSEYGKVTGAEPIDGSVYLVAPQPGDLELDGKGNGTFRLMIELRSERNGIDIKIPGTVSASEATGQLTATFAENPQLPFSDLKLRFHGGARAPLANPQECGSYATNTSISSWAQPEASVASSNSFEVTGCGASLPFAPAFSAGTASPAAGFYSPFTLFFSRNDGEQDLGGVSVTLPQGLLGKIAGVPLCGEAQANAGTCGEASQIGTTTASAGPGPHPYTVTGGRVYLTEKYGGGPFGLSIVVPAVAGPFNLGDVVVRAGIHVNPSTAQVTVTSAPLPQIRDGVPFRLRTVNVEINRPGGFTLNATNCASQSVAASIAGEHPLGSSEADKSSAVSSAYAASGCASLPFKPSLTASTQGKASKAGGASLVVKVSQKTGEANIHKVDLTLPKALPARLTTLQKACVEAQFNANPAGCPAASAIGVATAVTPLLNVPLTGPAYLVSHGGAAFPDVEFVLQGEGVEIVLDGKTQIKNGITYSRFETVPDAPISSFETVLPEGPHSILGTDLPASAKYSLCGRSLAIPTIVTGQNGRQITQQTKVAVTGCAAKAKALTRAQKLAKALKQCRKKRNKKKRAACVRHARKEFGQSKKAKK